jgi:tetratricopeptide (TPR) repeat protein
VSSSDLLAPYTETPLLESTVQVQAGAIDIQNSVLELIRLQGADLSSPIQNVAIDIQKGAVNVLKGALALQQSANSLSISVARSPLASTTDPGQLNTLGLKYVGNGHYGDAILAFQRALELSPSLPDTHKNLGDVYLNLGLLGHAITSYKHAIQLRPEYKDAASNLAVALLNKGNYKEAEPILKNIMFKEHGLPREMTEKFLPVLDAVDNLEKPTVSLFKILDRIEQLEYLIQRGVIHASFAELVKRLTAIHTDLQQDRSRVPYTPLTPAQVEPVAGYFDRLVHYEDAPRSDGPTMNESLDYQALEDKYLERRCIYFDNFLSPRALAELRQFFLHSTVFFRFSEAGFVASYVTDGFNCGLVFQLIEELHQRFPRILAGRHLNNMWCYRYCGEGDGVRPHNGDGSVTINFYLTPESANLDPTGGGMVMYDKEHPAEWDWLQYNMHKDDPTIQTNIANYLRDARAEKVPYKCNRAVLFHSTLFHKTDPYRFRDGFENRRMNITMLFGKRGQESASLR